MNDEKVLLIAKVSNILDKPFTQVAHSMSLMKIIEELVEVIEGGQVSDEGRNSES